MAEIFPSDSETLRELQQSESEIFDVNFFIDKNFEEIFIDHEPSDGYIEIQFYSEFQTLTVESVIRVLNFFSDRAFILNIRFVSSNSSAYYWRVERNKRVFMLKCEMKNDVVDYLKEFLLVEIKNGKRGIIPEIKCDDHQLINPIELCFIGDERGFNLLFLACEDGKVEAILQLLDYGMNVSYPVDGKIAADIAYEKMHYEALLCLLMANSRFPRNFKDLEMPSDVRDFLNISISLRQSIKDDENDKVKEIVNSNKNLRFFYDTNNESILSFVLSNKKFDLYELLIDLNLSFGPREDFEEIAVLLDSQEKAKLKELHQKRSHKVVDKHLMILVANSSVAHDNYKSRDNLDHVFDAFKYLNEIPSVRPILMAVAARRDFEIHFDFNRDTVVYFDPYQNRADGLYYLCGRILIGAKGLLYPEYRNEIYGVLIHELTHFAMFLVYKNQCKPYFSQNLETACTFESISKFCNSRKELEPLIQSVFDDYEEESHHTELIVRSPQLLAQYNEDEEKLRMTKENFSSLHDFFEHQVVPDVQASVPKIENEALENYRKALKKISRLQKAFWFTLGLFIVTCVALILNYEPELSWKSLNNEDRVKVLDSTANYRGLNISLRLLLANDSEAFEHFNSVQIRKSLKGNLSDLNHGLNTVFDQFIYLSPSNLTQNFSNKIFTSDVKFQGETLHLKKIASNFSFAALSSRQLKNLLSNESIAIGDDIKFTSFYIPRYFIDHEEISFNSSEVLNLAKASKIFLLADKPGSGKSITFQALRKKIKDIHPDFWVELIELKNHLTVLDSVDGESIADQMLKLKNAERQFFIDRFNNGKVFFLWDGFDEIAPDLDDNFLSIAWMIFNQTQNIQFISTRLEYAQKLTKTFDVDFHSLLMYTRDDRNEFIKGYLDESENLKIYQQVVDFIDGISAKESDTLRDDINNPLMLKMLVEIALSKKLSSDLDNIYKVYDTFMNLKLQVLSQKGQHVIETALRSARAISIDEVHMTYALEYILGDSFDNFLNRTRILTSSLFKSRKNSYTDHQISSFGILSISSNKRFRSSNFCGVFRCKIFN